MQCHAIVLDTTAQVNDYDTGRIHGQDTCTITRA